MGLVTPPKKTILYYRNYKLLSKSPIDRQEKGHHKMQIWWSRSNTKGSLCADKPDLQYQINYKYCELECLDTLITVAIWLKPGGDKELQDKYTHCEMQWMGQNRMMSEGVTIIYSGHKDNNWHGIGILLGAEAARAMIGWKLFNEHILTAQFHTRHARIPIIQVCDPTEIDTEVQKEEFYSLFQDPLMIHHNMTLQCWWVTSMQGEWWIARSWDNNWILWNSHPY